MRIAGKFLGSSWGIWGNVCEVLGRGVVYMPIPRDILGRLGEFWKTCCKVLGESWPDLEGMLALLPQGPGQLGFSGFPTRVSWELFGIFCEAPNKFPRISRREPAREFCPGVRGMLARMPHCFGLTDALFVKCKEFPGMVLGSSLGVLGNTLAGISWHSPGNFPGSTCRVCHGSPR